MGDSVGTTSETSIAPSETRAGRPPGSNQGTPAGNPDREVPSGAKSALGRPNGPKGTGAPALPTVSPLLALWCAFHTAMALVFVAMVLPEVNGDAVYGVLGLAVLAMAAPFVAIRRS